MDTNLTTVPEHVPFASITRLNRATVVSEKIHGSNFGIHVLLDGSVHAQSRKKIIDLTCDVKGFARWIAENSNDLATQLGPGLHFGEFAGPGIQKGFTYGWDEKRFLLFNSGRWHSEFNQAVIAGEDPDSVTGSTKCLQAPLCHVVPIVAIGQSLWDPVVIGAIDKIRPHGSYASSGHHRAEGIVVFHEPSQATFKVLCDNDEMPKTVAQELGLDK
jgi:hypothetical protein